MAVSTVPRNFTTLMTLLQLIFIFTQNKTVSYSVDLEEILGLTLFSEALKESSKVYGYLFAAIKTAVALNNQIGGESIEELESTVKDWINKHYKDKSIMNPTTRELAKLVGAIKGMTSFMTLGFSTRAFSREMLVSLYTGVLRANNYQIEGVTGDDFAFGMKYVIRQAPANVNKQGFLGQLNRRFQMAGQGKGEIQKSNFISDFGLKTADMENLAYLGTTIPDNYFRLAILIGRMHHDGCFEAYSLDENGDLKKINQCWIGQKGFKV